MSKKTMNFPWQLQEPLDAIIFDCDGTLSRIEGIDELAIENGVGDAVISLTSIAMGSTSVTRNLYEERLRLVQPRREQVKALGLRYFKELTPDIDRVIDILQRLGKTVFIMSAGLKPAVDIFATSLNIPISQVFAVDIHFDERDHYLNFDVQSPLTHPGGKGELAKRLKHQYRSLMYVGDGVNDIDTKPYVNRFIGYGGIVFRENVLACSDFYIQSHSLAPILPLALSAEEVVSLSNHDREIYQKGLLLIETLKVIQKI